MSYFYDAMRPTLQSWSRLLHLALIYVPPTIAFADKVGVPQLVVGPSMSPTLNPHRHSIIPDLVWVNRMSDYRVGDVVLLVDPMHASRIRIIKRVAEISPDGSSVFVLGDNPDHSTDSRMFGWVPSGMVEGKVSRVVFPPSRWGSTLAK